MFFARLHTISLRSGSLRVASLRAVSTEGKTGSPVAPLASLSKAILSPLRSLSSSASASAYADVGDKKSPVSQGQDTSENGIADEPQGTEAAPSPKVVTAGAASSEGMEGEYPVDEFGNKILYRGTQDLVVRLLFGASSFNFVYWTYYTASAYYYQGVVISGIDLGGDVRWGAVGAFATGLMFYATKVFKDNACMLAYLAPGLNGDGDRLGFQMHNFFGGPGRRVEASVGNVRLLSDSKQNSAVRFGSSFVPLRVKGMGKNVLIDEKGKFFHDNAFRKLLADQGPLSADEVAEDDDSNFIGQLDSKEKRQAYKPTKRRKNSAHRKK